MNVTENCKAIGSGPCFAVIDDKCNWFSHKTSYIFWVCVNVLVSKYMYVLSTFCKNTLGN